MNIESVLEKINLFEELVIESGFKRDLYDNIQAIIQPQNRNLSFMKNISEGLKKSALEFEASGLNEELEIIVKESVSFLAGDTIASLSEIDENPDLTSEEYFQKLDEILNELYSGVTSNEDELDSVREIFLRYSANEFEPTDEKQALVSLIFKDSKSIGSIKQFSKVLSRWNRAIVIYYGLLKSEPSEDVRLVEIQNGSVDVIFNLDVDVSINLVEVMKTGLKVYAAYLLYKSKTAKEIIESYMGNKKLIKQESEREALMMDNIKSSVVKLIQEQHKEALKEDKSIDKTSINKKIEEVSSVITDHVIKGNEMQLLSATIPDVEGNENEEASEKVGLLKSELRKNIARVRENYRLIEDEEKKVLLEKYEYKDTENTGK